jgi:hypothetical protein
MSLKLQVKKIQYPGLNGGKIWAARTTITHVEGAGEWICGRTKAEAVKKLATKMKRLRNKLCQQIYRTDVCVNMAEAASIALKFKRNK